MTALLIYLCVRCDALEHELELQVATKIRDPTSVPSQQAREYGKGSGAGLGSLQYGACAAVCSLDWYLLLSRVEYLDAFIQFQY
jgi:hypothetical protein